MAELFVGGVLGLFNKAVTLLKTLWPKDYKKEQVMWKHDKICQSFKEDPSQRQCHTKIKCTTKGTSIIITPQLAVEISLLQYLHY